MAAAPEVAADTQTYLADLWLLDETADLARAIRAAHDHIDVLINRARVFKVAEPVLPNGQDVRFVAIHWCPVF